MGPTRRLSLRDDSWCHQILQRCLETKSFEEWLKELSMFHLKERLRGGMAVFRYLKDCHEEDIAPAGRTRTKRRKIAGKPSSLKHEEKLLHTACGAVCSRLSLGRGILLEAGWLHCRSWIALSRKFNSISLL